MIMVGLSGGVDSSVTAYLLKTAGHDVHAVFMKNWREIDPSAPCPANEDLLDAIAVADHLDIPLTVVDFHQEYQAQVFEGFLAELRAGRTPNPDILCNARIKFRCFLDYALAQGATAIATGHYAQIIPSEDTYTLHTAQAEHKDQSYFLYRLTPEQLRYSLFPLGAYPHKSTIRSIAASLGLVTHNKKDSTGICFIGERAFASFVQQYLPKTPGPICDWDTKQTLGKHTGLAFYTLGQRKGLLIGGQKHGPSGPWFVVKKDMTHNILYVAAGTEHPALYRQQTPLIDCHWINEPPQEGQRYHAKTRYRQRAAACRLFQLSTDHQHYQIHFEEAQRSLTPGQSVVVYEDTRCIGGGIIADDHDA